LSLQGSNEHGLWCVRALRRHGRRRGPGPRRRPRATAAGPCTVVRPAPAAAASERPPLRVCRQSSSKRLRPRLGRVAQRRWPPLPPPTPQDSYIVRLAAASFAAIAHAGGFIGIVPKVDEEGRSCACSLWHSEQAEGGVDLVVVENGQ